MIRSINDKGCTPWTLRGRVAASRIQPGFEARNWSSINSSRRRSIGWSTHASTDLSVASLRTLRKTGHALDSDSVQTSQRL